MTTTAGGRGSSREHAERFPMEPSGFCAMARRRRILRRDSGVGPLEEERCGRSVGHTTAMRIITSRVHGMLDYLVGGAADFCAGAARAGERAGVARAGLAGSCGDRIRAGDEI